MMTTREPISVGSAVEVIGGISRGTLPLLHLPTGDSLDLRVLIVSAPLQDPGPTFLVTANIHGDEVTGVLVVHRFLDFLEKNPLNSGRVVIIPSLNPSGHLADSRTPLFQNKDPNRCWPEYKPKKQPHEDPLDWLDGVQKKIDDEEGIQVRCFAKIAEVFKKLKPDFHVDLHTFSTLSLPFVFLDRILYTHTTAEDLVEANKLLAKTREMVAAIGLTVLMERPAWLYVKDKLHRSTSGWTLNSLKVPSCTIELGPMHVAEPSSVCAGLRALCNICSWAGMIDAPQEPITSVPVLKFEKPHRYLSYPAVPATGIVDFQKEVASRFLKEEVLAIIRSMDGIEVAKVVADFDGYVIAWRQGVAVYEGDTLGMVAVLDGDCPHLVAWSSLPSD